MAIEIETSTDTVEGVQAALGAGRESQPPAGDAPNQGNPPADATPPDTGAPEEEGSEEVQDGGDEGAASAEPEKGKEKPPKFIPFERLSKVVKERNAERAENQRLKDELAQERASKAKASEAAPASTPEKPVTYSGVPKPKLADFQADPDKYPDPYESLAEAMGTWAADEALAKRDHEASKSHQQTEEQAVDAAFSERSVAVLERLPDFEQVVMGAKAPITDLMLYVIKRSEVGPDILYHLSKNPKEATRICALPLAMQGPELGELGAMIKMEIKAAAQPDAGDGSEPKPKPKPKTPVSSAPPPMKPLHPTSTPKSVRQMAGPEDKSGVDIDFSSEYEAAQKKRGQHWLR